MSQQKIIIEKLCTAAGVRCLLALIVAFLLLSSAHRTTVHTVHTHTSDIHHIHRLSNFIDCWWSMTLVTDSYIIFSIDYLSLCSVCLCCLLSFVTESSVVSCAGGQWSLLLARTRSESESAVLQILEKADREDGGEREGQSLCHSVCV